MPTPSPLVLAVMMLACFALVGGGLFLLIKRRDRLRGILMLVAALVLLGNVAILTVPL